MEVRKQYHGIDKCKPEVMICDHEKGTFMSTDVAISGDRNVIKKESENLLKYKYIITEIQRVWNVKTKVIPVITGATGTITKTFRKTKQNKFSLRLYC